MFLTIEKTETIGFLERDPRKRISRWRILVVALVPPIRVGKAQREPSGYDHIVDREERLRAWYAQLRALGLSWHEDPRIREQDFGNYQEPDKIQQASTYFVFSRLTLGCCHCTSHLFLSPSFKKSPIGIRLVPSTIAFITASRRRM